MTTTPTVARSVFRLTQADGSIIACNAPGLLGGNGRLKIYGRLDCPSALRALPRPLYDRIFAHAPVKPRRRD